MTIDPDLKTMRTTRGMHETVFLTTLRHEVIPCQLPDPPSHLQLHHEGVFHSWLCLGKKHSMVGKAWDTGKVTLLLCHLCVSDHRDIISFP